MDTQTINLVLPKELLQKVDRTAKKMFMNRSEFIRNALVYHLRKLNNEYKFTAAIKSKSK